MITMGMHVHAQIFLMWTGFLRLEILVKKKHMKGSSHESVCLLRCQKDMKIKYISFFASYMHIHYGQIVPHHTPLVLLIVNFVLEEGGVKDTMKA